MRTKQIELPTGIQAKTLASMSVAINTLRKRAKGITEKEVVDMLNKLPVTTAEEKTLLLRNLFSIMDREGGKEMGLVARAVIRWIEDRHTGWFYQNLWAIPHFIKWEYLWYNELRTTPKSSKKNPGKVLSHEWMDFDMGLIAQYVAAYIRSGQDCGLLAKWLPKKRAKYQYRKRVDKITGNVTRWKSEVRPETKAVIAYQNDLIAKICTEMGWTQSDYADWRKENQRTIEQELSKGDSFEKSAESTIRTALEKMATFARFRVMKLMKSEKGQSKWPRVAGVLQSFEKEQEVIAQKLRTAMSEGDEEKVVLLQKASKIKTGGGLQTFDILNKVLNEKGTITEMDTTHTNLMASIREKLNGDLYTVIDWSGSMDDHIPGTGIEMIDFANTLAITFSTMHQNPAYRNEFMIFAQHARVMSTTSKFAYGNKYQAPRVEEVKQQPIIDIAKPFSENLERMAATRRGTGNTYSATNMGAVFQYFIDLVVKGHMTVEELPVGLLFITDEEHNSGKHPTECMSDAAAIGWQPLIVWWGIENNRMSSIRCENFLPVGGYSEGVLSDVLTFLRNGAILPGAELLAINDNPRYSKIEMK